ncbi:unnamed protein product [Cyprideis torosa]|uniref:ubiquitinyl hydrolase 1 n=1 Tax=Cyprideis torosa TaxID=163714 RepID=A0A7R8ZGB7_9CRUS|nr:unnamed protein product [Cyprideis torosa]CAG0881294.1 unnamed protein product [Cyprideis torosa]
MIKEIPHDFQIPEASPAPSGAPLSVQLVSLGLPPALFLSRGSAVGRSLDPSPLIEFLDLERDVQQDVHEFCRLFTSLLEEQLQKQKIPSVRNLIRNLYRGEAVSVTRCSACGYESANKSAFYELTLHIKGHKELTSSILDYLKTEELVDGNQYSCPICGQKRDATIQTQVPTLPPILNLQLMRFEFNMASLTRKKLSTKVHFPEFLDASILQLNSSKGVATESRGNWYELFAVLLHKGTSASSGHYVAHIRDLTRQLWFEFNDEVVGEVDRKNLKTVFEKHDAEDSSSLEGIGRGSGGASKGKEGSSTSGSASTQSLPVAVENGDAKGTSSKTARSKNKASFTSGATFTSSNAYLLVYRKQTMNEQPGAEETIATPLDAGTAPNHSVASVKEEDDGGDQVSTSVPPSISPPPSIASSSSSSTVAGKRKKALENPESGVPVTSKRRKAEVNSCRSPCVSPPMEDHVVLPTWAQNAVDEDNANFESWCQETLAAKNNRLDTGRAQQSEIQNLYNSLPCENWRTEGFDLIATSWITNWLANGGKALKSGVNPDVPPIDNGKLQCEHGKADPLRMGQVKCVNPIAAEALYTLYGGGPRFTQDSLCLDCVRDVCQEKRIQMELEGVQKHLSSALKKKIGNPSDVPDSYWIGCASLRAWKRLALRQRLPGKKEKEEEEKEEEDEDCGPDASNVGADSAAAGNSNAGSTGAGGSSVTKFNEDIVCDHGNLCVAPQRRKLITKEAWDILRNQFSSCPEFPGDSPICESCANSEEETKERLAQWREMAKEQKEALPELFRNRDERDVRLMGETVHFVNQEFLSSWRRFIKLLPLWEGNIQ